MPIQFAAYNYNKFFAKDTGKLREANGDIVINLKRIPRFLLEASAEDSIHGFDATITRYDKSGKVAYTLTLKHAFIYSIGEDIGRDGDEGSGATVDMGTDVLMVDGIKL